MMLLPQFTIRTLFALTAVAAVVAWVLSQAAFGARWAQCAGWMLVFAGCLFGLYSVMFLLTWSVGQALGIVVPAYQPVASPFAAPSPSQRAVGLDPTVPQETAGINPAARSWETSQVPVNPFAQPGSSPTSSGGPQP